MSANRDQKYEIDDILSEIKSRKLREKNGAEPLAEQKTAPKAQVEPEATPAPEPPPPKREADAGRVLPPEREAPPAPRDEPAFASRPQPANKPARALDDFDFKMPDLSSKKKNPLEYTGNAPDISERAKRRGGLRGARQQEGLARETADGGFAFKTFDPPEAQAPPNTLTFDDAPAAARPEPRDFSVVPDSGEFGSTRVLPDMTGMRDNSRPSLKSRTAEGKSPLTGASYKQGKFALGADDDYYFETGDERPDDIPEGSVVDYSEYNSVSDRRDVQRDIARVKLWLFIRASLTLILAVALMVITLAGKYTAIPLPAFMLPENTETVRSYFIVGTALTILIAVVNSSAVGGGLMALFKMHSNSDTLAACAILASIGQGVAIVADPQAAAPASLNFYFAVASLAMLFNALGKLTMISRILSNFRILAGKGPMKAVVAAESDEFCHEFFKDTLRKPVIAHPVRAGFFTDFLGLSYSDKYDVGVNRAVAPVCLAASLVVCGLTFLLTGNSLSALSAFAAILCVSATFSSTFIENVPLARLTKKLAPDGGMVSGCKAVEDFCDTKAVVLTESELFPKGHVKLQGITPFSQSRLDEAITDAASVLCEIDGALGPVFLDMIGGNKKLLKKVDNIVFENTMGVSAWVDSRRVLIGNRRLMQNHGISLPPEAMQAMKRSPEAEPLFVSNSGEASAMFTVSYHADDDLAVELETLAHRGKMLIVHTTDANITADKLWELYGYPAELLRILPAEWHARYAEMTKPREKAVAKIVYAGDRAVTFVRAILACAAARSSILVATVVQLLQIVLGYALITFMAFMGSISGISVEMFCVYQLFWFAAIFIIQQIKNS